MKYRLNAEVIISIVVGLIITGTACVAVREPVTLKAGAAALSVIFVTVSVVSVAYGPIAGALVPAGLLLSFGKTGMSFDILQNTAYMVLFGILMGRYAEKVGIRDGKIMAGKLISYYLLTFTGVNGLFVLARPLTSFLVMKADIYENVKLGINMAFITLATALAGGTAALLLISLISDRRQRNGLQI
ncbi:MAG: hypothetical protein K5886_07775 [Lachnospiraceae bacterium]|nr:hypothetical protein [Lachnospiraceae bacterium]